MISAPARGFKSHIPFPESFLKYLWAPVILGDSLSCLHPPFLFFSEHTLPPFLGTGLQTARLHLFEPGPVLKSSSKAHCPNCWRTDTALSNKEEHNPCPAASCWVLLDHNQICASERDIQHLLHWREHMKSTHSLLSTKSS